MEVPLSSRSVLSTGFGVAPWLPTTRTGSARGVLGLMKDGFAQRGFPSMPCLSLAIQDAGRAWSIGRVILGVC